MAEVAIAFAGFMGAGKSEAARAAATALGTGWRDVDDVIELDIGESIATYFEREGEPAFRELEERVTLELLNTDGVVSLGGGAVLSPRVRSVLSELVTAWCRVGVEKAWERSRDTGRPLAAEPEGFARLYRDRMPLYEEVATAVLPEGGKAIGKRVAPWLGSLRDTRGIKLAWARSASAEYPAVIGPGSIDVLRDPGVGDALACSRWFGIADKAAMREHGNLMPECELVIELDASEDHKTLAEAERVMRELAAAGMTREDGLIAFGGGVVGDLAGFCAATYQRGVPIVQIPTTLVAQVDSAYGGKTGVDIPEAKNYIGAYHPPAAVLADPTMLATLPPEELATGFVEVLKTGLIAGGDLWRRVQGLDSLDDSSELRELIFPCALTKIDVVAEDERDSGRRAVLNLGHTVGHAIEAATGYSHYRHGEAVGLGLLAALRLSGAHELRDEVEEILARRGLPTELDPEVEIEAVLAASELDKKRTADGRVAFVFLAEPGQPREGQKVEPERLREAVEELAPS